MGRRLTVPQIETSLKRWHSKLKRAVKAIDRLEKAKRRAQKAEADYPIKHAPEPKVAPAPSPAPAPAVLPVPEDLDIPVYLKRGQVHAGDEAAIAEIKANMEAARKAKSAGRIAKLKADKSGERKTMPLSGKAALAKIAESV